jgi:DNA-directed RNA polymerase specialized sigma24 family protein
MQVHWACFGCTKEAETQAQRAWEEQERRVRAKVEELLDEPSELEIVATVQDEPPNWQIQAALHVPAKTVVLRATQNTPEETLASIGTGLAEEIERLAQRPVTTTLRREGLEAMVPVLKRCRQDNRSDVFFTWLAPALASLRPHVEQELRLREAEGELAGGRIIPGDVLNEVLVAAYERFSRRPEDMAFDLWLVQLADDIIDRWCREYAADSLEDRVERPSTEPRESSRDSWIEWATTPETVELGQLLPGLPAAPRWDALELETRQVAADRMLAQLPRPRRQALLLSTVHGFAPAEVADFQNRSEQEVVDDVKQARRTLEDHFREAYLTETEETLDPAAGRSPHANTPKPP